MGYRRSLERITGIGSLLDGRNELCETSYDLLRHADMITGASIHSNQETRSWENERVDGKLLLVGGVDVLEDVYVYLQGHEVVVLKLQTGWSLQIHMERISQRFPLYYVEATEKSFQAQPMNAQLRVIL